MIKLTEESVTAESLESRNNSSLRIETAAKLLVPLNSSTMNFARALSLSLNGTEISYGVIQAKASVFIDGRACVFTSKFPFPLKCRQIQGNVKALLIIKHSEAF